MALVQNEFRYRGHNYSAAEMESVWRLIAAHPVCLLESFIEPGRFRGVC